MLEFPNKMDRILNRKSVFHIKKNNNGQSLAYCDLLDESRDG